MPLPNPRPARLLACAALASSVLLTAGCSSSPEEPEQAAKPSAAPSKKASLAPVKHRELPNPCEALPKDVVEDVVPGAESEKGKNLPSEDTDAYGSCLWAGGSGTNDSEFRSLTVSYKRYDSTTALGSGDEQAERYYTLQAGAVSDDEANSAVKEEGVEKLGTEAVTVAYDRKKKDQAYTSNRVVVRDANVVVTVDYEGAGFQDAEAPGASDVKENARKAAQAAVSALS